MVALGSDIEAVELRGGYYFHGTRVFLDSDAIRRNGLLPLDQMVEPVYEPSQKVFKSALNLSDA